MGTDGPKNLFFYESCRLCLENLGVCDVFKTEELHQDIFACTGVKITQTDNLPHKICVKCFDVVRRAKQLRQVALKNDAHLQILFGDSSQDESDHENDLIQLQPTPETPLKCKPESQENGKNSDHISSKEKISLLLQDGEENSTKSPDKSKTPVKRKSTEKLLKVKVEEENRCKRTKIDDDEEFYCNECDKGFETYKKLYLHQRLHNKKIYCPLDGCNKKFATKGDLQKHARTHTGEKPFKCTWCEKRFTQRVSLRQHVLSLHPKSKKKAKDEED